MASGNSRKGMFILFFFALLAVGAAFLMFHEAPAPVSEQTLVVQHAEIQ